MVVLALASHLAVTEVANSGLPFWDRPSLCRYIQHKQTEGWSREQLRALALANGVPDYVIRWAQKNC